MNSCGTKWRALASLLWAPPPRSGAEKSSYRPDIDGLRALAIVIVIINHLGAVWMPGGFIGVDIFFVISGFLITGMIYEDITSGSFSFKEFYRRRIKRIVPIYLVVLLSTVLVGFWLMPKTYMDKLISSALHTLIAAQNIYFWKSGLAYFALKGQEIPLLHTWSLAVEEQFYMIWPLLLSLLWKVFRRHALIFIISILLLLSSFAYGQYAEKEMAYYVLPARMGELIMGALGVYLARWLARRHQDTAPISSSVRSKLLAGIAEVFALAGVAVLALYAFFFKETVRFPGLHASIVCLSTALVIVIPLYRRTLVSHFLSMRPFVYVGLLSYSLYMWHWPVISLYRYALGAYRNPLLVFLKVSFFIGLSILGYFLIEKPLRAKPWPFRRVFLGILVIPFLLMAAGVYGLGMINKSDLVAPFSHSDVFRYVKCGEDLDESSKHMDCVFGDKTKKPNVIMFGNSHAGHMIEFLDVLGNSKGFSVRVFALGRLCKGYWFYPLYGASDKQRCTWYENNAKQLAQDYDFVIFSARVDSGFLAQRAVTVTQTLDYVVRQSKKRALIIGQVPTLLERQCEPSQRFCPFSEFTPDPNNAVAKANNEVAAIAARFGVDFFDTQSLLCSKGTCRSWVDGKSLYMNLDHISLYGARYLAKQYLERGINLPFFDEVARQAKPLANGIGNAISGGAPTPPR